MTNALIKSFFRQGASHKPKNIPCQDYAGHYSDEKIAIISISDGHGGKKYFRSQHGAKIAVEVAINTLKEFSRDFDFKNYLSEEPFDEIRNPIQEEVEAKYKDLEYVMRHVFVHVVSRWHRETECHWKQNPLSEEELTFLKRKRDDKGNSTLYEYYFDKNNTPILKNLPSAYGCTLFGVVETIEGYWMAFHIGDGKCIAFREDGTWYEPIPWDNRCYQNLTTSLSHYSEESFRYCIGKGLPPAIFIASDGMDDSFAPESELAFEYALRFLYNILLRDPATIEAGFNRMLDEISQYLSKDDMSMAYIVWKLRALTALTNFCNSILPILSEAMEAAKVKYQEQKQKYDEKSASITDIEKKFTDIEKEQDLIIKEGQELQIRLDQLSEEREKCDRARKKFLSTGTDLSYLFKANEKSEQERELEQQLHALHKQLELTLEKCTKFKKEIEAIQRELPVAKKHADEAEKNVKFLEQKCERVSKVKVVLENYTNSGKEE